MKRFLGAFAMCLVILEAFLFFGGYMLLDFARHPFLAGGVAALILAAVFTVWIGQDEKMEALEKRVQELENKENDVS